MKKRLILFGLALIGYLIASILPEKIDLILLFICILLIALIEFIKWNERKN